MMNSAFAQTPEWYPGEGVKQDMYVKYSILDFDTNEKQPFVLTLYFQQQDQDGNWIVPAYVEANGKVLQGTLKLSDTMSPLLGGEVPQEMAENLLMATKIRFSGSMHPLQKLKLCH